LPEFRAAFSPPAPPISLLVAPGRRVSAKVRAFADFMIATLGEHAPDSARLTRINR